MTQQVSQLLAQALQLTEQERSDLVARLLESLDSTDIANEVEAAWQETIGSRLGSV